MKQGEGVRLELSLDQLLGFRERERERERVKSVPAAFKGTVGSGYVRTFLQVFFFLNGGTFLQVGSCEAYFCIPSYYIFVF